MSGEALDVVTVPDFGAETALTFEARCLFFLGSWLEQYGENGGGGEVPCLRLCCIGEPPASVRRLAARAGADVFVREPLPGFWGGFANKLRGLENVAPGRRLLLVDTDVLLLGGLAGLGEIRADFALAAAGKPQVPQETWETIYAALNVPLPAARMSSIRGRLGVGMDTVQHRYEGQGNEAEAMLPYHNSGVLLARGGDGLRALWEAHLHAILHLANPRPDLAANAALIYGDQAGLATALEALRGQGRTFEPLPDAWHARLVHLRAGALRWRDIRLFHATGFLRELSTRAGLPEALEKYVRRWTEAMREGAERGAEEDGEAPRRFLTKLWERWVQAEWERG